MFDVYTIPMQFYIPEVGSPEALEIPGSKVFTEDEIKAWVRKIEETYKLKPGDLYLKHKASGLPMRKKKGVNLSEIRRALVVCVYEAGKISVKSFGKALGVDHSSIIHLKRTGEKYRDNDDPKFMQYYHRLKCLPMLDCITNLTSAA